MKRLALIFTLTCVAFFPVASSALDPLAPRAQRSQGMIYVKTPQNNDTITITKSDGFSQSLQPEHIDWVPVGDYNVTVKMQEFTYNQRVAVQPTERTDVVVAGFGNLKVNSISPNDTVEVYKAKSGGLVAKFPASQTKTLPQGRYDVKISVGKTSVTKSDVWVVTNTTRHIDVSYADARKSG